MASLQHSSMDKRRRQVLAGGEEDEKIVKKAKLNQLKYIDQHMSDSMMFLFGDTLNGDEEPPPRRKNKRNNNNKKQTRTTNEPSSRASKGIVRYKDPATGEIKILPPTMSLWYNLYCKGMQHGLECQASFLEKFRRRFRLPFPCYLELVVLCEDEAVANGYMKRWKPGAAAANKKPAAPLKLLVPLCALRYLGRGWTFDDLEECTAISQEVIRNFFHEFVSFGADNLFKKWVFAPQTVEEIESVTAEYTAAGFPGCIGSMDATHIEHCRIAYDHRQVHLSFKLPFTARTYNIVTNAQTTGAVYLEPLMVILQDGTTRALSNLMRLQWTCMKVQEEES